MKTVRLRGVPGAPLAELRVVPFPEEELTLVVGNVKDPVTVPAGQRDLFDFELLLVRKVLGNFGVTGLREYEFNVIAEVKPRRGRYREPKIQRHTILCEACSPVRNQRDIPVRHLVLVTVDFQRVGLLRRARKSIKRRRTLRRLSQSR